ncbi:sirtuin [Bermanella marisrubri]|uniref:protein acetyllysine N-acetyltransferase n=1 Tax=Bermanella marisrubri TaxID=207949 RepID=Q1N4Y2_9GAMM|nr:Sir2 family NAD-dependent protein deacetylase [Bermanella marisrubri]EAT13296.1 putative sirtuin [Oceanobacter sp. RED65] [Bermanella marisrubri]QIZ84058.1 sirtuin [Bermanella marisrubri]
MNKENTLFITGAGISAESGIPTFRGEDGFWTIGSRNYTPMEMATRHMYQQQPEQFLAWYYNRFITYRHHAENDVHRWLADKNLITQNIDGLDGKAGNKNYIAIHGRIDKMTLYHTQGEPVEVIDAPWDQVDDQRLNQSLMHLFNIKNTPTLNESYKPFVLLFDEYYTDLYRIDEALSRMEQADKMVFMGTSFSVNITNMAMDIAMRNEIPVEVVDPDPVILPYAKVKYHKMRATDYIQHHD